MKVAALGFVMEPFSYLRDPWNMVSYSTAYLYLCVLLQVDFFVVIVSWVQICFMHDASYSSIRIVRILRPLRTISAMPAMSGLV